ncbi:hypothetical protein [Rhodovibrio salinarum]|uniref:Uncharacterized protein n=1 Tax=Rhodovibrio salinarum TaxID=1087 RepID=A0A934QEE4_9PROT|nr:hypothetical protein [Rhodovibrio salinarum]MBK1695746.1 hypothetical protein [Rhodovibrio salinarum]
MDEAGSAVFAERDETPGIWLVRDLLLAGGLTIESELLRDGQPVRYARTVVTLDADVVTTFRADAARDDALVAAHFERVQQKVDRLGEMPKAIRLAATYAAFIAGVGAFLLSDDLPGLWAGDFGWLRNLVVGGVAAAIAPFAVRALLHWLVRRLTRAPRW